MAMSLTLVCVPIRTGIRAAGAAVAGTGAAGALAAALLGTLAAAGGGAGDTAGAGALGAQAPSSTTAARKLPSRGEVRRRMASSQGSRTGPHPAPLSGERE